MGVTELFGGLGGYAVLVLSALAAAVGMVAQTVAARRTERRGGVDPGLLARLATDRVYLFGFGAQVLAFGLAFFARATLPLYIVQAGSSSAVGVAAVLAFLVLGWRVNGREIAALGLMVAGLLLLVGAAQPSVAGALPPEFGYALLATVLLTAALAVPAARLAGARGAVAMGALAGVAFAVVAVAGRQLAAGPLLELPFRPLAWLMVAAAVVGQAMLAGALQRASTTVAAASMDAVTVVLSSVVGLTVLGDQIAAGRGWWVAGGLTLVVLAVVAMAVVGRPVAAHVPAVDRAGREVAA